MKTLPVPRTNRDQAIAAYAAEMAGTELDLDPELEAASLDILFGPEPGKVEEGLRATLDIE